MSSDGSVTIDFDALGLGKSEKAFDRLIGKVAALQQQIQAGGGLPGTRASKAPPSFGSQFMKVLSSSRFGAGGIMPLVGQVAKLVGPVGMMAIAAIEAGKAIFELSKQAAEAGIAFAKLGFESGGGSSTGALSALGGAIGANLGEMARHLNEQMKSNPYAMMHAGGMGIQPDFTPGGGPGMGDNLLKYITGLRKIDKEQGRAVAIQTAYADGMEGLLGNLLLSDAAMKKLNIDVAVKNGLFSKQFQDDSAAFMEALRRFGDAFKDLVVGVFGPMLPTFTKALNDIADALRAITIGAIMARPVFAALGELIMSMGSSMVGNIPAALEHIGNALKNLFDPEAWKKAQEDAMKVIADMQIRAIKENTGALDDNTQSRKEGTFGGGARAGGATPRGWGPMNQQHWTSEAYRLGAF